MNVDGLRIERFQERVQGMVRMTPEALAETVANRRWRLRRMREARMPRSFIERQGELVIIAAAAMYCQQRNG